MEEDSKESKFSKIVVDEVSRILIALSPKNYWDLLEANNLKRPHTLRNS
jgi:hypothetical protein